MKIALTNDRAYATDYPTCAQWLHNADAATEIVDLSMCTSVEQMEEELHLCDGLVLTGGEPVATMHYDKEAPVVHTERDGMELKAFDKALALNMPMLGIGRGMWLINTALGGTVYTPYTTQEMDAHYSNGNGTPTATHPLTVIPGSLLTKITGELEGDVPSTHEQAIERLAGDLAKAAISPDGIVEAIEWATPQSRPFLFAVAWHPERMAYDNVFSHALATHFLFEATAYEALVKS